MPAELMPSQPRRRLVLWRHGQTQWNRDGRAQGHADVPLDETGCAQARRTASTLASYRPAFVWSSDLLRARQTANELAALTGHEIVLDPRLREFDVGARQGMTHDEFAAAFPDLLSRWLAGEQDLRIPGAEVRSEVGARMVSVLNDAAAALEDGQTGVLVGHGGSLRTGVVGFLRFGDEQPERLAGLANCAWAVLADRPGRSWQLTDYNVQTQQETVELVDDPSSPAAAT